MSTSARAAVVGTAICALLAGSASAVSAPQAPAGGGNGSVAGDATNRLAEFGGPVRLKVFAQRRSNTEVSGYAYGSGDLFPAPLSGADFQVEGHVTCLRIEPQLDGTGTAASIKYRFEHVSGSAAPSQGGGVEVFIEDNGKPVGGRPVDANATAPPLSPEAFEAGNPQVCDDPNIAGQPYNPVDSGDYVIHLRST